MPTISLPDDLFARLQDLAIPLVDSPADVVRRMLDERETAKPEKGKLPMEEGT